MFLARRCVDVRPLTAKCRDQAADLAACRDGWARPPVRRAALAYRFVASENDALALNYAIDDNNGLLITLSIPVGRVLSADIPPEFFVHQLPVVLTLVLREPLPQSLNRLRVMGDAGEECGGLTGTRLDRNPSNAASPSRDASRYSRRRVRIKSGLQPCTASASASAAFNRRSSCSSMRVMTIRAPLALRTLNLCT